MKPHIIWVGRIKSWLCVDDLTSIVGLGPTPSYAWRVWWFGKRSLHGTGRRS